VRGTRYLLHNQGCQLAAVMMASSAVSNDLPQGSRDVIPNELRGLRVHLIGIGGCGMSGLAALLLRRGARVSGSDMRSSAALSRLEECGARISTQQDVPAMPADVDLVIASAAIPENHPEFREARRCGAQVIKYAQMLGRVMSHFDGIAISGTHGKSTTTAWLTYVLRQAGLDPNFVVGADVGQLGGSSGVGDGCHFIAEACEYDRSFLNLQPRRAGVLNIEEDHLDCYADLSDIQNAFATFVQSVRAGGLVVLNGDDDGCRVLPQTGLTARVETFGFRDGVTWQATMLDRGQGCYAFDVVHDGEPLGRAKLGIPGRHNVGNALAVIALAHDCGVSWNSICTGLAEFLGVRRRLELRGDVNGLRIIDDYAHHPTEIRATLHAARERYAPRRLWCVFQPHQHSRTRFLLADFADSFSDADRVVVPDIYFVRDSQRDREAVCAEDLVERIRERGGAATYVPGLDTIVELLAGEAEPGDVVLTMGAGDIWKVADGLVERLGRHLPG